MIFSKACPLPPESLRRLMTLAVSLCAVAAICSHAQPVQADDATASDKLQPKYELSDDGWQALPTYPPNSPEGKLVTIRKMLAQDKPCTAKDLADRWMNDYPNHPMRVEALLLRADARTAKKSYYKALFDYELLIREYPGTEQFRIALQREYEIARLYVNGVNRHFIGLPIVPADGEGEELLIRIQERAPGSAIGEKASLTLADYYFRKGEMFNATEAYDLFLINYPQSEQREWAMLRLIQANLARFKGPRFDGTGLIEARERIRLYQAEYPAAAQRDNVDALLTRIDGSLGLRDYYNARWYERRDEYVSAVVLYRRLIKRYPTTEAAQLAIERLGGLNEKVIVPERVVEKNSE